MRRRRMRSIISLCTVLLVLLAALPATAQETNDRRLKPGEQDAVGAAWLDELRAYYASGDPADLPATTPSGLEALRAHDWRFGVVEAGLARFRESWDIIESTQWDEAVVDGEHVSIDLRIGLDVERLAETLDGATGRPLEMTDGVQRRVFNAIFVREPGTEDWRLDDIGPPKGSFDFGLVKESRARPCPRLGDPGRAGNPFRMQPWCTANGDGQRLELRRSRRTNDASPAMFFLDRACGWDDALFVDIGWPPGEPIDTTDGVAHRYVRDYARALELSGGAGDRVRHRRVSDGAVLVARRALTSSTAWG